MKPGKTWRAVPDCSRDVRFPDALRPAAAFGYVLKRVRGSHHIPIRPAVPDALNLQLGADGKAKSYQLWQLVALVERYGLGLEK